MTRIVADLLVVAGLLAVGILPGFAIQTTRIELGTLEGEGWSVDKARLQLVLLEDSRVHLQLDAASVQLPETAGAVTDLQLVCTAAELTTGQLQCADGELAFHSEQLGRQVTRISFNYHFDDVRIKASLRGLKLLGGRLVLHANYADSHWQLDFSAKQLSLETLARVAAQQGGVIPQLNGSGRVDITGSLQGSGTNMTAGKAQLLLKAASFSDDSGGIAAEDFELALDVEMQSTANGWRIKTDAKANNGGLYIAPVYLEVGRMPITAHARFDWLPARQRVELQAFDFIHPDVLDLHASGRIDTAGLRAESLDVEVKQGVFPALYETWLQPWLTETMAGELESAGRVTAQVNWRADHLQQLDLELKAVTLHDKEGRFGLDEISGRVKWLNETTPVRSQLEWSGGNLYRVALGPASVALESGKHFVRLREAARIPVLDGALQVEMFNLEYGNGESLRWQVDSILTPVSMSDLTLALGWPEFAGKLSGIIPAVSYADGNLQVGGVLLVRVFDGEVTLRNLQLERPFGVVPRLQLDAEIRDMDLETLTRTFSFGRIEGRLEGEVSGLKMESWRPVEFDAAIRTPENDSSRHRISQRAVDNISNIGGAGVGGALSRGFLRFIKNFPYSKLGISCRLQNGVCEMGGVAPAADGYYLIKGRTLPPRLDVIGYADRVDWGSLVSQIMAVTRQQDVIVQ